MSRTPSADAPPKKNGSSKNSASGDASKSLESWLWDAACKNRGVKDAPSRVERDRLPKAARRVRAAARINFKDFILPLVFTKRLCDVFDDEINRIAQEVGSRKKAFQLAKADHTAMRGSALPESEGPLQVVSEAKDNRVRFYLPLVPDDPEQPVWSVIRVHELEIAA